MSEYSFPPESIGKPLYIENKYSVVCPNPDEDLPYFRISGALYDITEAYWEDDVVVVKMTAVAGMPVTLAYADSQHGFIRHDPDSFFYKNDPKAKKEQRDFERALKRERAARNTMSRHQSTSPGGPFFAVLFFAAAIFLYWSVDDVWEYVCVTALIIVALLWRSYSVYRARKE